MLEELRSRLIRQEETIIFALIERAQFKLNLPIYQPGAIPVPGFAGSFSDFLLHQTELIHAQVRRYTSPDEHPFFRDLPPPILPPMDYPQQIRPNRINLNATILRHYHDDLLPLICAPGDCHNYGSSATCDVACLQALSKRIHYGKFIAEAKFQEDVDGYTKLIQAGDEAALLACLTDPVVEDRLLQRVARKAAAYGQEIGVEAHTASYKIAPETVAAIYATWIIPLTKDVELRYLRERLRPA